MRGYRPIVLALLLLTAGCFTPTKSTVYGYLASWGDDRPPTGVYSRYQGEDRVSFQFERVDEQGYLRGTCAISDTVSGPCAAATRGNSMLLLYPVHADASAVNPDDKTSYAEGEAGWAVATYNIQGENLVCRAAAEYFDWGPNLSDVAWGDCIGEKRPARLTAAGEERVVPPPEPAVDPGPGPNDTSDNTGQDADDGHEPTVEDRLEELERLKEKGLVTEEEYQQKRQEILSDL